MLFSSSQLNAYNSNINQQTKIILRRELMHKVTRVRKKIRLTNLNLLQNKKFSKILLNKIRRIYKKNFQKVKVIQLR